MDQNILGEKLTLKLGYFHNMFNHQLEGVDAEALNQYFGLDLNPAVSLYEAYVNSLAYSAQGAEAELAWQPRPHFLFRGGYTYLDARVLQSFASDAVAANQGEPTENPNIPGVPDWRVGTAGGRAAVSASSEYGILQRPVHAAAAGVVCDRSDGKPQRRLDVPGV